MATYVYRCTTHGDFPTHHPMGAAPATAACPHCREPARRVFTAPLLSRTSRPLAGLLAREEQSRDQPEVVSAVPPARRRPTPPAHPAWSTLPRP